MATARSGRYVDRSDGNCFPAADAAAPSESERTWDGARSALADDLLPLASLRPEDLLATLLEEGDPQKRAEARRRLLMASARLFRYVELLAGMEDDLKEVERRRRMEKINCTGDAEGENQDREGGIKVGVDEPCALSGLPSLYTGGGCYSGSDAAAAVSEVDAETVWGQVDLQNDALMPRLKRSVRKLRRRADNEGGKYSGEGMICMLDIGTTMGSDENDGNDSEYDPGRENDNGDGDSGSSDEGSKAQRIRERMERAMADIGDSSGETSIVHEKPGTDSEARSNGPKESKYWTFDPARESMRDGFFDLHEMEAFADDEEKMLPDDAYGDEMPEGDTFFGDSAREDDKSKKKAAMLPHLRDRMGGGDSDSDYVGEEENDGDPLSRRFLPTSLRRKKYRADDEVEALYQMYKGEDDDSDGKNGGTLDASAMTAAEFFGKPDQKLVQSYKQKKSDVDGKLGKGIAKKGAVIKLHSNDTDADSWDNQDFEEDGIDWKDEGEKEEYQGSQGEEIDGRGKDAVEEKEFGNVGKENATHSIQSQKLKDQTLRLEQEMMTEKPWRMMGEAKGADRATDSLLDSTPEFQVAFKPPPVLTEDHTAGIEDMIKRRIIYDDWDDVIPRELPDIGARREGDGPPDVSQEKSKLGLGELYEREYLKKTMGYDRTAAEKQTEEGAAKGEMKHLFANLCSQLDALSNYHFAPRPVAQEADVRNMEDSPAIAMEEVLPLHVSDSRGAAPEEVYAGGKGRKSVLKGESELDQVERKRIRKAKKVARRKARRQKHADEKLISKLEPGLGLNNPYEKRKLREELQAARASGRVVAADEEGEAEGGKEYQTSAKFFLKMQENMEGIVRGEDGKNGGRVRKKRKQHAVGQTSSFYRL